MPARVVFVRTLASKAKPAVRAPHDRPLLASLQEIACTLRVGGVDVNVPAPGVAPFRATDRSLCNGVDAGLRQPLANQRRLGLIRRDGHHLELVGHSSKATGPGPLILTRRRP
jgi:hypothetical protein